MKIQISPKKHIHDAVVIWPEQKPEVDIVIDPRQPYGLKFRPGSLKAIYAFGIFGLTQPKYVKQLMLDCYKLLEARGQLYIIEHNFDYVCRAYLGGDIPLNEFNEHFRRQSYINKDIIIDLCVEAGFIEEEMRQWFSDLPFEKKHFEFVLSAIKPLGSF